MEKYVQQGEKSDTKKYRGAFIFLIVTFILCTLIGTWGISIEFSGKQPLPVKIFSFFWIAIWSIIEATIVFAFIVLKMDSKGGEIVYVGKVTKKESLFNTFVEGRGNMHTAYYFELDNQKRFKNVNPEFYKMIEEGQKIQVHTTRFSKEILSIKPL